MSSRLVFNASPLIILGKADLLPLLPKLARELIIPGGVAHEIQATPTNDAAKAWLAAGGSSFVSKLESIDTEVRAWDLGRGESEVLTFARQSNDWTCVIDDRSARNCATALGLKKTGTLGILIQLKRNGLVPRERDVLAEVLRSGYYISPDLIAEVRSLLS